MLQMTTRENKATEREKQGVERNVLALDWVVSMDVRTISYWKGFVL